MKVGILGLGEVGQAIKEVYLNSETYDYDIRVNDKKMGDDFAIDMEYLHICIPYSENFIDEVVANSKRCQSAKVIIHSTVPVGTTKKINERLAGDYAVHSPIRGVHPKLYEGVKTFVKYIGYDNLNVGIKVQNHFMDDLGLEVATIENSMTTELGKLLSTTYYGMAIAFHNYANNLCKENGLDFGKVMTHFNGSYNLGYKKLGMENVIRPVLYAPENGKIGGHCIIPNAKILREQFGDSEVLKMILDLE